MIYHHNSRRRGGHLDEIRWLKNQLPDGTMAYYWCRVSNRTFFIINPDGEIRRRLLEFENPVGRAGTVGVTPVRGRFDTTPKGQRLRAFPPGTDGRTLRNGIAAPAAVVQPQRGQRHAQAQARTWKRRFRAHARRCRCARAARHRRPPTGGQDVPPGSRLERHAANPSIRHPSNTMPACKVPVTRVAATARPRSTARCTGGAHPPAVGRARWRSSGATENRPR